MRGIASDVELKRIIADFIALLSNGITVDRVMLFGSYANGTPHEWSDIDLAVVSPDFEGMPTSRRQARLAVLTLDRDRRIAPLGYAPSEYQDPGRHSFLGEILRTGRTVYQTEEAARILVDLSVGPTQMT